MTGFSESVFCNESDPSVNVIVQGEYGCGYANVNCQFARKLILRTKETIVRVGEKNSEGYPLNSELTLCWIRWHRLMGDTQRIDTSMQLPKFRNIRCIKAYFE